MSEEEEREMAEQQRALEQVSDGSERGVVALSPYATGAGTTLKLSCARVPGTSSPFRPCRMSP